MKRLEGGELMYPKTCPKRKPGDDPCQVSEAVNFRREERKYFVPLIGPACGCVLARKDISTKKPSLSSG